MTNRHDRQPRAGRNGYFFLSNFCLTSQARIRPDGVRTMKVLHVWVKNNHSLGVTPTLKPVAWNEKLDDGWPESEKKYSKICNCEDRIAWKIQKKNNEDVSKKKMWMYKVQINEMRLWTCEDVRMWWRCEQLKMWRCDEMKMWAFKDVRMWWGKMWICEDVMVWR